MNLVNPKRVVVVADFDFYLHKTSAVEHSINRFCSVKLLVLCYKGPMAFGDATRLILCEEGSVVLFD